MKNQLFLGLCLVLVLSCTTKTPTPKNLAAESIIPLPSSVEATGSSFALTDQTSILLGGDADELKSTAEYLAGLWRPTTGLALEVKAAAGKAKKGNICLHLKPDGANLGNEGYELTIAEDSITIEAYKPAGIFYGIQTLRQLLPASMESGTPVAGPWEIATGVIRDQPDYAHRGSMLDVARHFFSVDEVKRYIDLLAAYKMNVLHLHLSDDQGWRIEIKSWPKLTEHGGSKEVGGGEGGFYTQEQYADIVKYAQNRFITIIPEIDMPGHTNAALASYAELNCDGKARELYTGTEVGFSTLCVRNEATYQFVGDVIREISALSPGPYFHIGGDESHVTAKDDYIYFVNRVQDTVQAYGKQMIGWDEVANAALKSGSIAQFWDRADNALAAVNKGAKVILSPAKRVYLDMQYDSTTRLGLHWAAYIEVDHSYNWQLETIAPGIGRASIVGMEAPLWTETIDNMNDLEYMVFPRLLGCAEIAWTPAGKRNWEEYKVRLAKQKERLQAMQVDFYASKMVPW